MTRSERNDMVEKVRAELVAVRHAILIDYRGITVPQVTELRSQVRGGGGRYAVVKNTLLSRAVEGSPLARLKEHMKGPTALIWSEAEPVALAKTLVAFGKIVPVVQVKALLLDGEPLPGSAIETVAAMPGRDQLRAQLVGILAAPMRRLLGALSAPSRGLGVVLAQKAKQ